MTLDSRVLRTLSLRGIRPALLRAIGRIALDAGHGASRGHAHRDAPRNGLVEDDLALDFVTRIGHHLRLIGYDTVITRPDGKLVALATRGKRAIDGHCDLFISIHLNAGPCVGKWGGGVRSRGRRAEPNAAGRLVMLSQSTACGIGA